MRHANVRLVCATNCDLKQMVSQGRFRADLFYRINCMQVELPPLRHRRADLPELINYFLGRVSHKAGISEAALNALLHYNYPGNMRELRNILDRAIALAKGERIDIAFLPDHVLHSELAEPVHPVHSANDYFQCDAHQHSTSHTTVSARPLANASIQEVLAKHHGNRRLAAEALGITERTLYRKLKLLHAKD
jgi:DNA-binding NtrC family response regulator